MEFKTSNDYTMKNDKLNITFDKYSRENIDIKKSPLLYLLQIATQDRKINQKQKNKNNLNLCGNNLSINSKQEVKKNDDFLITDIDIYLREIIDNNDSKFLSGEANLFEHLIANYLNIEKEKISEQESIEIKIDLQIDDYNVLNEFGIKMPKLKNLNLENSILINISNIGTSFKNLQYLNVNNCQIEELEGKKFSEKCYYTYH